MNTRFHGITSLGLIAIAIIIAAVAMFQMSWIWGATYLAICIVAPGVILYAYCAKCPCQVNCGHVFPGKVAMRFENRQPGPTTLDLMATALALLLLLGLPNIALWQNTGLLIGYWVLNAIALVQIRAFVCRTCDNVYCPARSRKKAI